ncbi:hypothetical protein [Salinarimonas sp.]|uniref:hypothetical protein n=1 Tax=Salinarimonas sp. TaxID=2766526 RepID=UPI0032D9A118
MGDVKRKQRPEPAEAPGLADESVNASRRAGPEPDPGDAAPADRAKIATDAPGSRSRRETRERS